MADFTQENRRLAINTPLGTDKLLLVSFQGEEQMSRPFSYRVRMLSEQDAINPKDIVGQNVTISCLDADDEPHYFNGHVREFVNLGHGDRGTTYTAHVVPALWFLTRRRNCRIFQDQTVLEVIQSVLDEAGLTDYDVAGASGSYDKLTYCVQYNETDFDFVSRLMEEYGIFYFFVHDDGKHTLTLADAPAAYLTAKHDQVRFAGPVSFDEVDDNITQWEHRYEFRSGKVAMTDYNFETAEQPVPTSEKTLVDLPGNADYELYSHPGRYLERGLADKLARVRMEEEEAPYDQVAGGSKCRSFAPGYAFTIEDHHQDSEVGKSYVLTAVKHSASVGAYISGGDQPEGYTNTFTCIPKSVVFRPARTTPRARVEGPQTAVVVGPSGEEIYTDKYGRVKVKFHWDRTDTVDDTCSCWVRVSQVWAGRGWGGMQIPRVGQEVIVDFLNGDPDQPIITGRVYNSANPVPFDLPDNKTISGLKSNSSPGGGGFNELRFEDKKDQEQVFLHAQKNRDTRVRNDDFEWVGNDQHLIVKNNQVEQVEMDRHTTIDRDDIGKISRDRHLDVGGKEAKSVGDSHSFTVKGNVVEVFQADQSTQVSGNLYIKAMGTVIEASSGLTIKCGGNSVVIDPSGVTIKGNLLTLDGSMVRIASGPGSPAMSGMAGTAVSPTAPQTPEEADEADPGEVDEVKARQKAEGGGKYGSVPAPAFKPKDAAGADAPKTTWIEIELVGEDDKPIPGERYVVTLPDGSATSGTLDSNGYARVEGFEPGQCKVTFPELDKDAWEKA